MKIRKVNLKRGLKIVRAATAERGGKRERPRTESARLYKNGDDEK